MGAALTDGHGLAVALLAALLVAALGALALRVRARCRTGRRLSIGGPAPHVSLPFHAVGDRQRTRVVHSPRP